MQILASGPATSTTGDRAELDVRAVDPGVGRGERRRPASARARRAARWASACFAERPASGAAEADVVVVNTHLYGMHLASRRAVLPEHDVVVFDEAHQLEDIVRDRRASS